MEAKVISNNMKFDDGEKNGMGRPPRPLMPGRRKPRSSKAKELEHQLFDKAIAREKGQLQKRLVTSTPRRPQVNEPDAKEITQCTNAAKLWVPNAMTASEDITIGGPFGGKPWGQSYEHGQCSADLDG